MISTLYTILKIIENPTHKIPTFAFLANPIIIASSKTINDTNPKFNSLVEWTLRITNNGPDTATGVVVCDILPDGLIAMDKSFNGTWNVGQLLANQTKELTIICFVNKTGRLVNIASNSSLTKGKIQLQSEGAEIFYRNIYLTKLD